MAGVEKNETKFSCHGCGACCMMVGDLLKSDDNVNPEYLTLLKAFPYKADKNGWCEKMDEDLKCSVYEERPLLCRINDTWKALFSKDQKLEDYHAKTTMACKRLMEIKLGMTKNQIKKVYDDLTP